MKDDFKPVKKRLIGSAVQKPLPAEPVEDTEPAFVPPEEIAEQESVAEEMQSSEEIKTKKSRFKFDFTRKQLIIGGVVIGLILAAGTAYATTLRKKPAPPPIKTAIVETPKPVEPPKPTTEPSRLTGVEVSLEQNQLPTTSVMIENSPDARPQSGLTEAGVVFEAIAEGGITRFNAIYMESTPERIGPVRSVRPYYVDLFAPFDAPIAHAGGSAAALALIKNGGFKDLDQFANGNAYYRDSGRYAPHNLYTSRENLLNLQRSKGWSTSSFTGFARKKEAVSPTPNAKVIDFKISSFLYNPHFEYDVTTNSYKRSLGGKPHVDEKSSAQISPKVVVALVMPHHYEGIYSSYQTTGSGKVYVFQDGIVQEGTWHKADIKTQLTFKDAAGAELKLNPGQTWVSLVSNAPAVTFTP